MSTPIYQYMRDPEDNEMVHLVRQADIGDPESPHPVAVCGLDVFDLELGDETVSGIAATCLTCVNWITTRREAAARHSACQLSSDGEVLRSNPIPSLAHGERMIERTGASLIIRNDWTGEIVSWSNRAEPILRSLRMGPFAPADRTDPF